jgi:hypothetical protein
MVKVNIARGLGEQSLGLGESAHQAEGAVHLDPCAVKGERRGEERERERMRTRRGRRYIIGESGGLRFLFSIAALGDWSLASPVVGVLDGLHALSVAKAMQPIGAGADRTESFRGRTTPQEGSRCSG